MNILDFIGYLASVIVAISLMMNSIIKLRWFNLVGSLTFSIYGFLIGAIPVGILNGFIVFVNIWYLIKIYKSPLDSFEIIPIMENRSYHKKFLDHYQSDVKKFFPHFNDSSELIGFYILRNMIPAGLFLGKQEGKLFSIEIDYAVPEFRDFELGKFIFQKNIDYFKQKGVTTVVAKSYSKIHDNYLKKIGFKKENELFKFQI